MPELLESQEVSHFSLAVPKGNVLMPVELDQISSCEYWILPLSLVCHYHHNHWKPQPPLCLHWVHQWTYYFVNPINKLQIFPWQCTRFHLDENFKNTLIVQSSRMKTPPFRLHKNILFTLKGNSLPSLISSFSRFSFSL